MDIGTTGSAAGFNRDGRPLPRKNAPHGAVPSAAWTGPETASATTFPQAPAERTP